MADAPFTELVDEPGEGRVFERGLLPGIADAGAGGRVRLDAVARWLQDIAYADFLDYGADDGGLWIMRRGRIRVERFARFGEPLKLRTFCSGIGRFSAERRTLVRGETAVIDSVALWIWIDAETGRPRRFPPGFAKVYEASAAGRDAPVRLHHADPPADAERREWTFRAAEEDIAGHVNNSHLWVPLEEELAGAEPQRYDAEIEFREPTMPGPATVLRAPGAMWITQGRGTGDDAVSASIRIAD